MRVVKMEAFAAIMNGSVAKATVESSSTTTGPF
jgi:hypothetical protein